MAADGPCVNDIGFAVNVHLMRLASVAWKAERCGRRRRRPECGDGARRSQQEEDCT